MLRHAWVSGASFGGGTLLIHLLDSIIGVSHSLSILYVADIAIFLPTYWILQGHGIAWSTVGLSGLALRTLLIMIVINAAIGTLCWITCRAFWLGVRPFFSIS